jgi:peptide/nickel transport system substrate-binding protein
MSGYWDQTITRRRAIVGAGAVGLAAATATFVGCGGSNSSGKQATSNLTPPQDTSDKATRGGIFQTHTLVEPTTLDAIGGNSTSLAAANWVYSKLVGFDTGKLKRPDSTIVGDLADAFEVSPDGLQVTFHLRQAAKWDQRAPTSGRAVDADDVLWSWNRFATLSSGRTNLINTDTSPNAPVTSVSAPDKKTIVAKLAFPSGEILDLFGSVGPFMMPREFDDKNKVDVRNTMLGTGAWVLDKFTPAVGLQFRRNPNWWRTDRPFVDGFDLAFIKESAQEVAQFRAGNTWWSGIPAEQQLQTKADFPELQMVQSTDLDTSSPHVKFGWRPDSPFKDERLRRAVSMAIDRDLYADTMSNRPQFEKAGFPQPMIWASHVGAGMTGYWLDPRTDGGKALGDGGKYYQHNPPEAKKLMSAAGFGDGLRIDSSFNAGTNYGANYHDMIEIITGMIEDIGFKVDRKPREYQNDWLPNYFFAKGDFNGISWVPGAGRSAIGLFLQTFYHSSGQGNIPPGVDPKLDDMVEKQSREVDKQKRVGIIQDIQRYLAANMELVPYSYALPGFSLAWPWVGNFGTFVAWPGTQVEQTVDIHTWIDKTRLPDRFKSS